VLVFIGKLIMQLFGMDGRLGWMGVIKNDLWCLILIAITISGQASAQSLTGKWDWSDAPNSRTFSIEIKQWGKKIEGQYCAVAQNGNRVDCDDERNPNIKGMIDGAGRPATVEFSSFFGAQDGKATLTLEKNRLIWHVIKIPVGGEFYAPNDAVLDRIILRDGNV
jgi:hypothetical protein